MRTLSENPEVNIRLGLNALFEMTSKREKGCRDLSLRAFWKQSLIENRIRTMRPNVGISIAYALYVTPLIKVCNAVYSRQPTFFFFTRGQRTVPTVYISTFNWMTLKWLAENVQQILFRKMRATMLGKNTQAGSLCITLECETGKKIENVLY